jgi:hypothetical protein
MLKAINKQIARRENVLAQRIGRALNVAHFTQVQNEPVLRLGLFDMMRLIPRVPQIIATRFRRRRDRSVPAKRYGNLIFQVRRRGKR